jgi:hypothetical protein
MGGVEVESRRRGFIASRRRHTPLALGASYGFLRPPRRSEEDEERFRERLRNEPQLRREYRSSILVQLTVVGALFLACLALIVQALVMVRRFQGSLGWMLPVGVGFLALLVLRRFLRLVSEYRRVDWR